MLLWRPVMTSNLGHSLACTCVPPISASWSHGLLPWVSPLYVSERPQSLHLGPSPTQHDLVLTRYICKGSISEEGHLLRFWMDMTF